MPTGAIFEATGGLFVAIGALFLATGATVEGTGMAPGTIGALLEGSRATFAGNGAPISRRARPSMHQSVQAIKDGASGDALYGTSRRVARRS